MDEPLKAPASALWAPASLRRFLPSRWRSQRVVIPVLRLNGVISSGGPLRAGLNMARLAGAIERAFSTRHAKAVALVVNSPGGSPAQSHLIMRRIRAFSEEKKVPVIAFVEDVAASGGYMIACAADEIIADPASILGSIGVVSASFGFDRLIEKIGIERRVHTAGRSKAMLDPFRPEKAEDVARLEELQRDIHAMFIDIVRERRGERLKGSSDELFTGEFWTASRAVSLGLADGLGDVRSTLRKRYGEGVRLKPVGIERGLFGRRATGASVGVELSIAAGVIEAIEERASWARFGL